ncbi:hypothetical protein Godav_001964 [Gossypium davidsonii]|uniref:Uncharacterized protein n=1 Tax=Gossypium davidsonii TaxID=34287 RepID=A0A7J8T4M2_GOSDV|nr:hypothetical protein [Gossypium davidsonii]
MGLYSLSPFNLLIEEPYATIFWVRFWIIFTEIRSRWLVTKHIPGAGE